MSESLRGEEIKLKFKIIKVQLDGNPNQPEIQLIEFSSLMNLWLSFPLLGLFHFD